MTEGIESNLKAFKFKVKDGVRINKYRNIFSKVYTNNWSKETFLIDPVLKSNPFNNRKF